ncbi:MAG TPA: hypothetical protein VG077_15120 [Verrucomicrobiae bacterium]|nr:hypothetical protein [Verrucomicrobiae bacterium]
MKAELQIYIKHFPRSQVSRSDSVRKMWCTPLGRNPKPETSDFDNLAIATKSMCIPTHTPRHALAGRRLPVAGISGHADVRPEKRAWFYDWFYSVD